MNKITDEITTKIRKMSKKEAQDYLVRTVYMISDWAEYNEEEIRQYDEISVERDLYKDEKDDYNVCMSKFKIYSGLINLIALDLGVRD